MVKDRNVLTLRGDVLTSGGDVLTKMGRFDLGMFWLATHQCSKN